MKVKSAAKINLMLDILKRLDSGYHSLFMIMQSVSLYDTVTVERGGDKILIECDDENVPCNEKNIAYKCAEAFFDFCKIDDRAVRIKIEKNIPVAAGTAGGSADGAAVLYSLNKIYSAGLSQNTLCEIGAGLGADIPFSLVGGTAVSLGIGDIIAPVKPLKNCRIILVKPDQAVSTPIAYAQYDTLPRVRHLDRVGMLEAVSQGDYKKICTLCGNVFEQAVEVPERPYIKSTMHRFGADAACMSGSGPTVYGLFSDYEKAQKCYEALRKTYNNTYICEPADKGIIELMD
ncbi:MAG: 4-(cytidine 5'-diphospho)-2-C-methyl-D-erythritol kinase [Oscillospiraceae bacterium]|nr:4-(cytidine 5'-diphospho)-2-C-methyl-D-erythritol kinase [Oscillospiraceae bacterium]